MNLIFQNACATYARSVVALALGLFSSRWVLQALGASDFGLYAVVGALVGQVERGARGSVAGVVKTE